MEKKKKRRKSLATKNAIAGYLFISPFLIGLFAFMFIPLLESLRMCFSQVNINVDEHKFSMVFSGLSNFKKVFLVDPEFVRLLVDELIRMVLDVPATIIFSFFIAVLLNQKFKGRGLVRSIFFLPVILSAGVMVGLETNNTLLQGMQDVIKESNQMSSSITGVLEKILVTTGGSSSVFMEYVFGIVNHVYDIAIASGIQIIIFLSGLQTISQSMFEAAKIEGATEWESFWKITVPMISSLILVNVVYTIIDFFIRTDNQVMEKISETMTQKMDYGFTTAMAWVYFMIVMVVIGVVSAIISKRVYYYE
ncbi:carbohydrate ABC transporter permease [Lachnoclostridium sp.]|uniref:carbohydrate ABC transporter permease n=1 Tax=Lachnoclostridium sp. TaxID=2028282 RepID=UPI00289CAF5F|nr:sugar ABC transporter permease [Lachnoclostridium sp.]